MLSPSTEFVVAGPILPLALRAAAASWKAPLAVSPPPFRITPFRRSPLDSLQATLADRPLDGGAVGAPDAGAGPATP